MKKIKWLRNTSKMFIALSKGKANNLIPVRMANINKITDNRCLRGTGERGTLIIVDEVANCSSLSGNQCGESLTKLKINLPYVPAIPFFGTCPKHHSQ